MKKRDELADPKSCLNRAQDDEPIFVLLGRDPAAAETIRYWARRRVELGQNQWSDPKIVEAIEAAANMELNCLNAARRS